MTRVFTVVFVATTLTLSGFRPAVAEDAAVVKGYIQMLIQEIVVADEEAIIRGSFDALAQVLHQMKMGTCKQVPSSIYVWRPRQESNL